ncbi:MAG: glycosyltransferase [Ignavibacteriaceae bacterium]|nr:glycosyltransferase [Ignavibacteriaceae bacterium]
MSGKIFQFSFGDGYAGSAKIAILSSGLLAEKGYRVTLFVSQDSLTEKRGKEKEEESKSKSERGGNLKIVALDSSQKFNLLFEEIVEWFEKEKPDFVISHHSLDRKVGLNLKRKFGKRFTNIAYRHNITKSAPIIGAILYNYYFDYLIACSGGVGKSLTSSGIFKKKVEVIHNGIEAPKNIDEISSAEIKIKYKLQEKIVLGLSTWFHKERKGFDILFNAFSKFDDKYILLLVGIPETQQTEVINYAKEFGIDKTKLIMPGYVDNIWEFYKAMDIFLLPSRSEGFSLALLEAGVAGLPIIASDIPGNNEFIKDGENGLLFQTNNPEVLKDKIKLLSENNELKNKLSQNAQHLVFKKYLISHYADRLDEFLKSTIKQIVK